MTLSTLLTVGDAIPIATLLEDGNTGQYPQAIVTNQAGTTLTTLDLTHVSGGLYTAAYNMPDENFVEITYIVYSDVGHTTVNPTYGRDLDIFVANVPTLDSVVEGTLTTKEILRLLLATLAGKSDGGGTQTVHFRDLADAKNRITAVVTTAGNRTSVTLDVTD